MLLHVWINVTTWFTIAKYQRNFAKKNTRVVPPNVFHLVMKKVKTLNSLMFHSKQILILDLNIVDKNHFHRIT